MPAACVRRPERWPKALMRDPRRHYASSRAPLDTTGLGPETGVVGNPGPLQALIPRDRRGGGGGSDLIEVS